jgi:hypothetical protein
MKVRARAGDATSFVSAEIERSAVGRPVDTGRLRAIAEVIIPAERCHADGKHTSGDNLDHVAGELGAGGLDAITSEPRGDLGAVRLHERAAAINRLRTR